MHPAAVVDPGVDSGEVPAGGDRHRVAGELVGHQDARVVDGGVRGVVQARLVLDVLQASRPATDRGRVEDGEPVLQPLGLLDQPVLHRLRGQAGGG